MPLPLHPFCPALFQSFSISRPFDGRHHFCKTVCGSLICRLFSGSEAQRASERVTERPAHSLSFKKKLHELSATISGSLPCCTSRCHRLCVGKPEAHPPDTPAVCFVVSLGIGYQLLFWHHKAFGLSGVCADGAAAVPPFYQRLVQPLQLHHGAVHSRMPTGYRCWNDAPGRVGKSGLHWRYCVSSRHHAIDAWRRFSLSVAGSLGRLAGFQKRREGDFMEKTGSMGSPHSTLT